MSLDATRWAWMQQGLRPVQKLVLLALADRADAHNMAFPSYECLKFDTGLDRKTIWLALKELAEADLIVDSGEKKGKTKSITVWQLNGIEHRNKEKQFQKRNSSESETVPETARVSRSENGITKQFQKRNSSKNGIVPFFPRSSSKNGTSKQFQKRNMEPIKNEPTKEPVKSEAKTIPPDFAELKNYLAELGGKIDPEQFFDHYEANGWMVGKTKMKDWKATARKWHRTETSQSAPKEKFRLTTERIYADFQD